MPALPWWLPSLWIGSALLLFPGKPWIAVLGYHGICLASLKRLRWGRAPRRVWAWLGVALLSLAAFYWLPPLACFPRAHASQLLSHWPGGLWGHAAYALIFNVALEEAFWRGTVLDQHPA